jgi:predicted nucleic acid-binding protein
MPEAITNTSPLLYLHRISSLTWLHELFSATVVPSAVVRELKEGRERGYDVPDLTEYAWLDIVEPRSVPSEWLALDLGAGELSVLALGLEDQRRIVLLDDGLARRIAQAAGLTVWGTLKVLLEAKRRGLTGSVEPLLRRMEEAGMWISDELRERVLALAGESGGGRGAGS